MAIGILALIVGLIILAGGIFVGAALFGGKSQDKMETPSREMLSPEEFETRLWADIDPLLPDRKIEAIKVYREYTGASLKEAKKAIDHRAGRFV